ncbi:YceD family protein [Methyloglobulus sp.]|uniref:YceD family protein n=1 Tax=Methyloglobulus sp. TaxID=2518622 RepID=UPI003989F3C0
MLTRLPKFIDPLLLADRNARIEGELPLSSFDRMTEWLSNDVGNVLVKLFFGREGNLAKIEGHISTVLALKCQRCLEPVEWPVSSDIKLGIVSSLDQANNLPEGYEPLLLIDEDNIPFNNIVEDELLLNIPDIPKHQDDCTVPNSANNKPGALPKTERASTENPFSILADLKKLETYNGSTKE